MRMYDWTRTIDHRDGQPRILDRQQGKAILDRQARRYFNLSGKEFVRAWRAGELDDHPHQSAVTYVAMLTALTAGQDP